MHCFVKSLPERCTGDEDGFGILKKSAEKSGAALRSLLSLRPDREYVELTFPRATSLYFDVR